MEEANERSARISPAPTRPLQGFNWTFGHGLQAVNLHRVTSAPRRIREDIHQVLSGLGPLVENTNSSGWLRAAQQVSNQTMNANAASARNDFVINIEDRSSTNSMPTSQNPSNSTNNNNNNNNARPNNGSIREIVSDNVNDVSDLVRNSPELRTVINFCEKYVFFLLILLLKILFDHSLGIIIIIGLFFTFVHANTIVKREVSKQAKRQLSSLLIVTTNLITCIGFVYLVLADENLAFALVMIPPYSTLMGIWDVLWIITVTDFVLKLLTILLKIAVVAVPGHITAFQKKGKMFLFLESTSQLYRSVAPMQHWLFFFSESYSGSSKIFGVVLSAAYLVTKCRDLLPKIKSCKKSFSSLLQSVSYGVIPSEQELKSAGEACAICQDEYRSPTMLQCKHIFCEECVLMWFDRERTCPMCRAQIADDPSWRDGSTTFLVQVF